MGKTCGSACIWHSGTQMAVTTDHDDAITDIVRLIVESCVCLHNIMRVRYSTLQNGQLDMENQQHDLVSGLQRTTARMHEINRVVGPNMRQYLKDKEIYTCDYISTVRQDQCLGKIVW